MNNLSYIFFLFLKIAWAFFEAALLLIPGSKLNIENLHTGLNLAWRCLVSRSIGSKPHLPTRIELNLGII